MTIKVKSLVAVPASSTTAAQNFTFLRSLDAALAVVAMMMSTSSINHLLFAAIALVDLCARPVVVFDAFRPDLPDRIST